MNTRKRHRSTNDAASTHANGTAAHTRHHSNGMGLRATGIGTQTRLAIPETFRKLRRVCGDPKSAPECRGELDELEKDIAAREAKDAFIKMRMKCILHHDSCDSSEA